MMDYTLISRLNSPLLILKEKYLLLLAFLPILLSVNKLEKALQESEGRFRALFENAPDAIFLADIETGKIVDVNFAACQLMQKTREEIISLHQSQLHPPETEPFVRQKFIEHSRLAQENKNIPIDMSFCVLMDVKCRLKS
ncbi:conserved hypothetical protein [Beggiatoa sp. PS]|nr:conserved hypothetical protein [Beggiatoa sp. PS]